MNKVRVEVVCWEPIAIDHNYKQTWSDIDISFRAKPHRRVYRFALTLISKCEVESNLKMAQECKRETASLKAFHRFFAAKISQECEIDWDGDISKAKLILHNLNESQFYVESDENTPVLYTASNWIDRFEAEKMLRAFLRSLGFHRVRFSWERPDLVITPV